MSTLASGDPLGPAQEPRLPWWLWPAAVLLVTALLGMLLGKPPRQGEVRSVYDATEGGTRAVYLLLDTLDYPVRPSRRLTEGRVRWLLYPTKTADEETTLSDWVARGNVLLLAGDDPALSRALGLEVRFEDVGRPASPSLHLPGLFEDDPDRELAFIPGPTHVQVVRTRLTLRRTWPEEAPAPLVSIFSLGRGEIWLAHYPALFLNGTLRQSKDQPADNALLLCGLVEELRRHHPQTIYLDEYFHGLRDRPSPLELLFRPPLLWITLHGLLLLGFLLWRYVPRFGPLQEEPSPRRRSKDEYLDAVASLLEQKRAYGEVTSTVRNNLVRELEQRLNLPAGCSRDTLVQRAARQWPRIEAERWGRLLAGDAPEPAHPAAMLAVLHEVERLRHDAFVS